jgi:hypothetical protein
VYREKKQMVWVSLFIGVAVEIVAFMPAHDMQRKEVSALQSGQDIDDAYLSEIAVRTVHKNHPISKN